MRDTAGKQGFDFYIYMNMGRVELTQEDAQKVLDAIRDEGYPAMCEAWGLTNPEMNRLIEQAQEVQ